ncbi:hypothetical protein A2125_02360 [Candidatus Woesebacteria bacterium GWB1_43_5]|uniref:Uncharacterized protein n=1 Tax=Candidatus Woesebacteria bacterium GWB1_43_5 TaxID=1802474 RepID=A0A1F7WT32_9BACT|nr:MAG: hypothetical protein A2125_02360 [Candidatus Woesebacteria bacterium GWB1_43_5]
MKEIPGFREALQERKKKEMRLNGSFSGPEAAAMASIEVLASMEDHLNIRESSRGVKANPDLVDEIWRRRELIQESPVYRDAVIKEKRRLCIV